MSTRLNILASLAAILVAAGGCASPVGCGNTCRKPSPYAGMKYDAACESCGPGCADKCGAIAGSCGEKVQCGDQCTACGGAGCRSGWRRHPVLDALGACLGCGDLYWNEWYSDPPACAEPCDCYGNYVGPGSAGYFRAPYRRDAMMMASPPSTAPPLEVAPQQPAASEPYGIEPFDALPPVEDEAPEVELH